MLEKKEEKSKLPSYRAREFPETKETSSRSPLSRRTRARAQDTHVDIGVLE